MPTIDFWYSIGSTYSYLTVMRLAGVEARSGLSFRWRPMDVRSIMVAQNNIPFKYKPVKTAYMWRDIERRAARYGLHPRLPAPYPLPGLVLANLVATIGAKEGWIRDYTIATYRRWIEGGDPAGQEPNLSASLSEIGCDPETILLAAETEEVKRRLRAETEEARKKGIFGSPTFDVEGELFWGDDRLEDAVDWALNG
jgi:2-hydroxychromene-2-carboxylate isomerase